MPTIYVDHAPILDS